GVLVSPRAPNSENPLAVARSDRERIARRGLFSALRSKLGFLYRAHAAHRRRVVFRRQLPAALVAKSFTRLPRRNRFFHSHVRLAWRARRSLPKFFPAWTLIPIVDLSRAPFC